MHDQVSDEPQNVTLDEAQKSLMALYAIELDAIKEKLDKAFDDFNLMIASPEDERKPFAATIAGMMAMKSFTAWLGDESTRSMQAATSVLNYHSEYSVEARHAATRIIQDVIVGMKQAMVQTGVEELRMEFYPQSVDEHGEANPPWFNVVMILATVTSWEQPSVVESEGETSELPTDVIDTDAAGEPDPVLGEDL